MVKRGIESSRDMRGLFARASFQQAVIVDFHKFAQQRSEGKKKC